MSTTTTAAEAAGVEPAGLSAHPRRWLALVVIATAQLMVVLDATVVNIALPNAEKALHISVSNQQWVVTAYTLTFGGLLLLGGRIADYWGRKRAFVLGIVGFALASALGGLAQNGPTLFAARALQGCFGALLAPASLALLSVLFVQAKERAKAFGVYGAIAGGGSGVGLVLGGILTEHAGWRWCLLVNIPVALLAVVFAIRLVPESRAHGDTRYDIPGAVLATLGLVTLVYGFTKAGDVDPVTRRLKYGWDSPVTLGLIAAAIALLAAFVVVELRSKNPLLPMRILLDRTRGGAYLSSTLVGAGFIGAIFFVSLYFQNALHYTPIKAGLATLPLTAGVLVAAGVASALLPTVGPKVLMAAGGILAAGGMIYLTQVGVTAHFASIVLPAELVLGLGLGFSFVPMGNVALLGVSEHDAGAASAVINASQQVGGSIGTALLNTVAISAGSAYVTKHIAKDGLDAASLHGQVNGYVHAFAWGSALLIIAAVVVLVFIKAGKADPQDAPGAVHIG